MTIATLSRYQRPRTLDDALALAAIPGALVLAGGTDVVVERRAYDRADLIIDVSAVEELRALEECDGAWRIGAAATWSQISGAALPPACAGLQQAARQVGGRQVQDAGTIGGNLCTASPAADGLPPILVLDCMVEVRSGDGGVRGVPIEDFVVGYRRTILRPGELVCAVVVPAQPAAAGSFVKLGSRSHLVISIAMAAVVAVVRDGVIEQARVAVGACSPVALRLRGVERALAGCSTDASQILAVVRGSPLVELSPIDDVRGTADFRRTVVPQLVADAVSGVWAR